MMNYRLPNWSASAHRLFGRAGVVAVLALTLAACDDPLAFRDPDFVRPDDLAGEDPSSSWAAASPSGRNTSIC